MLRASVEASGLKANLMAVADPGITSGIPAGAELLAFADAVSGADSPALSRARAALLTALGPAALVQAAAIAANFSMNDRAANATGIILESIFVRDSADYRAQLGIDRYASARNTLK